MNNLETIEDYLTGQLNPAERTRFEATLRTDPALAESLAFYVQVRQVAQAEAHQQRKAELDALRQPSKPISRQPVAPMRWVAAASVLLLLGLGWLVFRLDTEPLTTAQLTDTYLTNTYGQLSTTMGGDAAGPLEQGIDMYNRQQYAEAEAVFAHELTQSRTNQRSKSADGEGPGSDRLLKFAGLAALQQRNYTVAIQRFHQLGERTDLVGNPGFFLEALTRIKRNEPMDKKQAKTLLDSVITKNLEGKTIAEKIIDQL